MGLLTLFDDPLAVGREWESMTLHIHSPLPERVPIGHYDESAREVIERHVSRADYIDLIRQACVRYGSNFSVYFYDHSGDIFDAAILDQLPELESLSIGSIFECINIEAVARLPALKRLNFSPVGKQPADILRLIGANRLEWLTLGNTFEPKADLTPLGQSTSLKTLRLLSRGKNLEAIGNCASLVELSMHPAEKDDLSFIGNLPHLETLKFTMGKRSSITQIEQAPALRTLSFHWVNTLEDLGDLQRFPTLWRLQIEDQKRLRRLKVGPANLALEHINSDGLDDVEGFSELPALKSFNDFNGTFRPDWSDIPPTVTHFALWPPSLKKRELHNAEVRAHGLIPELHPDAQFFYK